MEIDLLNFLSKIVIEFGIFDSEGEKRVEANIVNTDNTTIIKKLKVKDIMYFTEYGTLTIPGKRVLEKSLLYINRLVSEELSKIIDKIFEGLADESYIIHQMQTVALKIRNYIRNYMKTFVKNNNRLGDLIHKDQDDNQYLYDLDDLSKYIECKIEFKN